MHPAQQAEAFALPGDHDQEHHQGQRQRQPTTREQLQGVSREHRHIDNQQDRQNAPHQEAIPMPVLDGNGGDQDAGQHHGASHRDTIGCGQVAGVFEAHNHQHHGDIQGPVDHRDIDLAGLHFRGMNDTHR
ncbi:hypothetical protein D3C73_352630 [compost metagenome]